MPAVEELRGTEDLPQTTEEDDEVEREVGDGNDLGEADCLAESEEKDDGEEQEEPEGEADGRVSDVLMERVVCDGVPCGVGGREGHGDDEVCAGEAEEDEDKELALPAGEEVFEESDGALADVGAFGYLG